MSADRAGYVAGLRQLADLLEQTPDLPLPYQGRVGPLTFHHLGDGPEYREAFLATVRALPGLKRKSAEHGDYFDVDVELHGLKVQVTAYRETVCERVVTGSREVTREVPCPEALAAVPTTTVTETVEDVEWRCQPLLAPVAEPVSA